MSDEQRRPWAAAVPRWQHRVYLLVATLALVAGVVNALEADTTRARIVHTAVALVAALALVVLGIGYAERNRAER